MKTLTTRATLFVGTHANTLRIAFFVLTLALFIFAAGAAEASGTIGH